MEDGRLRVRRVDMEDALPEPVAEEGEEDGRCRRGWRMGDCSCARVIWKMLRRIQWLTTANSMLHNNT